MFCPINSVLLDLLRVETETESETDRQTDRQAGRRADRQTDRDRQIYRDFTGFIRNGYFV